MPLLARLASLYHTRCAFVRCFDVMPFNVTQGSIGGEALGRRGRSSRTVTGATVKHILGGEEL